MLRQSSGVVLLSGEKVGCVTACAIDSRGIVILRFVPHTLSIVDKELIFLSIVGVFTGYGPDHLSLVRLLSLEEVLISKHCSLHR